MFHIQWNSVSTYTRIIRTFSIWANTSETPCTVTIILICTGTVGFGNMKYISVISYIC